MKVEQTSIPGVLLFEPRVFPDARGYFLETYSERRYQEAGVAERFVQDNVSCSSRGTLRGLHYQHPDDQGKLVQVLTGEVFDVAVDIRRDSPTFGRWFGVVLSAERHNQMYLPPGLAHGFYVLSERALFSYKCTDYYAPGSEGGIVWNDPDLAIDWPLMGLPVLSEKDQAYGRLADLPADRLPAWREARR